MRGRPSVWRRTEALEARAPRAAVRHGCWDLDALSVEELEALVPLSEKQAAAAEAGNAPAWTPGELALLKELAAKEGAFR